jgi:hypothetical protein
MATKLYFSLNISRDEALRFYQGLAKVVIVTAHTGQKIQFPAEHIRPFIDQNGIQGQFCMQIDSSNKLMELNRI